MHNTRKKYDIEVNMMSLCHKKQPSCFSNNAIERRVTQTTSQSYVGVTAVADAERVH